MVDPKIHPKDRTTGEEWAILNLADTWLSMDDGVRASRGASHVPEAAITMMALEHAIRRWREARVYDPNVFEGVTPLAPRET